MNCKQLRTYRFMEGVTTAEASAVYLTDFRFGGDTDRTLQGVLTSGASVAVYTYMDRVDETVEHLVSTFSTSSFATVIDGPVAKIKVVKTSAAGTVWVEGLV